MIGGAYTELFPGSTSPIWNAFKWSQATGLIRLGETLEAMPYEIIQSIPRAVTADGWADGKSLPQKDKDIVAGEVVIRFAAIAEAVVFLIAADFFPSDPNTERQLRPLPLSC